MKRRARRAGAILALAIIVLSLPACGQLITVPTPTPAATPTAGATPTFTALPPTPTALPLTPLPTATATITPTPVIYKVQKGDNLLAIAKLYGVTVEAIQEANGILDPRTLQIGQNLLIPLDPSASKEPPTPTPTPLPYNILGVNFQTTPSGRLWCLGEIENTAGVALQQVVVAVSLFDASGKLLVFSTGTTELDVVPSGERAPFAILFDQPPATFAHYQTVPLRALPATRLGTFYLDLEILGAAGEARGRASYSVSGRVRNAGDRAARNVRVVITAYDEAGKVVAVRKVAPASDQLAPGRSSSFDINLLSTAGTVVTYTLRAEGLGEAAK